MTNNEQRADFDAWAKTHYYLSELGLDFENDEYVDMEVQGAFEAYQAGRAALQSQDREDARWLVFNVGCIECGVSSDVVGVFATEEEAERVATICSEALSWREGGQNSFEVFDLQSEQASEYSKAIDHARRVEGGNHE